MRPLPADASRWLRGILRALGTSLVVVTLLIAGEGVILRWMGFPLMREPARFSVVQFCPPRGNGPAISVFWSNGGGREQGVKHYVQLHRPPLGRRNEYFQWPDITPRSAVWTGITGKLALGSQEGTIFTWDASEYGKPPVTLGEHPECAMLLSASADGRWLASANDGLLCLWDLQTRKLVWTRRNLVVRSLAMHSSNAVVCGTAQGSVWQLDLATGRTLREVARHGASVDGIALSPDGQRLASLGNDRQLVLSDWERAEPLWTQPHHPISPLCFSPAGDVLVTCGFYDNLWTLVTWEAATGRRQADLVGHTHVVLGITCASDNTLYSWSSEGAVRVWNLARAKPVQVLRPEPPC